MPTSSNPDGGTHDGGTQHEGRQAPKGSSKKNAVHGVLVVNKPTGPTSHDVVAQARRLFGTRRVGHAGTLDPMASGVLLVLFGEGTKLAPYLTADDKRYRATVSFGKATDSGDSQGAIIEEVELAPGWLAADLVGGALAMERVRSEQVPPVFSAIKVAGQRSHRLARRGEATELPPRPVAVRSLELVSDAASHDPSQRDPNQVVLELCVSKGYYVRSLARDLGAHLGVPAHLSALERTASGAFGIAEAHAWPPSGPPPLLTVLQAATRALPSASLTPAGFDKAAKGKRLDSADFATPPLQDDDQPCAWVFKDQLVAIGGKTEGGFAVRRGFAVGC